MSQVKSKLLEIRKTFPGTCTLVAVSKTKPAEEILEAYRIGQRDFGENKVQELVEKATSLPADIRWHMIGHLQRNKVKYIAPFVHLIHGVDSLRLLIEINKRAKNEGRIIDCLLQMHIATEESKFGFDKTELFEMIRNDEFLSLENIRVVGLMGMATYTEDKIQVRREFRSLKELFDELTQNLNDSHPIDILSMGMSGDYDIALKEGSNMIRIGSAIFGKRQH